MTTILQSQHTLRSPTAQSVTSNFSMATPPESETNRIVNVFVKLLDGRSICVHVPKAYSIGQLASIISRKVEERIPHPQGIRLATTKGHNLAIFGNEKFTNTAPVGTLLSSGEDTIINLRLCYPLCGGKGGFGSQLRAAGGKMSSRKKKRQGEVNGSNRNLDGRRLRTVTEAKALAEYLAIKPEMDKKEKEERRKRWQDIIDMTERKQEEIKNGGKGRLDGAWVEAKDEATEKTREAVIAALSAGEIKDIMARRESDTSMECSDDDEGSHSEADEGPTKMGQATPAATSTRTFHGWDDDDDEDMSDSNDESAEENAVDSVTIDGKGKKKVQ